jgi:hypothetical protein
MHRQQPNSGAQRTEHQHQVLHQTPPALIRASPGQSPAWGGSCSPDIPFARCAYVCRPSHFGRRASLDDMRISSGSSSNAATDMILRDVETRPSRAPRLGGVGHRDGERTGRTAACKQLWRYAHGPGSVGARRCPPPAFASYTPWPAIRQGQQQHARASNSDNGNGSCGGMAAGEWQRRAAPASAQRGG